MEARVKFLRYINSKRLIYRFEWDMVAVPLATAIGVFVLLTLFQLPAWASPFFSFVSGWKALMVYKFFTKESSPGYLYHLAYSMGLYNPTVIERDAATGKKKRVNPKNIPFGFENEFRD